MIALDVPAAATGTRLDRFLADALGSRARAQRLIEAGRVRLDGVAARKREAVREGQRIEVDEVTPAASSPAPPARFAVAYEDDHLLVVDKPAGVVVHPARGHRDGTLVQALADRAAGATIPGARGSCTASTATPRGCSSSPARTPSTARSRR